MNLRDLVSPRNGLLLGLVSAAGFLATAIVWPRSTPGGLLIAFLFWSGISIGSITAMMIHRLTGGAWGHAYATPFGLAASAIVFVYLIFIAMLFLLPQLYPWMRGHSAVKPDVAHWYLNVMGFSGRSIVAFSAWTAIALGLTLRGPAGTRIAAAGLAFHGLVIGAVGLDWIQSVDPPFFSTSFGASLAFTQLIGAFAAAAVLAPVRNPDPVVSDLGGLLLATILGLVYIDFMAYLIIWYGDLPHKVEWFVQRDAAPWVLVAGAMFVLACVVPAFSLFSSRVRRSPVALRLVGIITLTGLALYYAWLVGPAFGPASLLSALFCIVALGVLLIGLASRWPFALPRPAGSRHVD